VLAVRLLYNALDLCKFAHGVVELLLPHEDHAFEHEFVDAEKFDIGLVGAAHLAVGPVHFGLFFGHHVQQFVYVLERELVFSLNVVAVEFELKH
jgi:hypothetical protein